VYKCLHQLAPLYLVSLLTPVTAISTRRHLRSADLGDLATLRTKTVGFGPRSFSAAGPSAWNSLLLELKDVSLTIGQFTSQLKTELFLRSYYVSAQPEVLIHRTGQHWPKLSAGHGRAWCVPGHNSWRLNNVRRSVTCLHHQTPAPAKDIQ